MEVFTSDKQHVLDLYCSKGKNCCYKLYWPSFGMAYGNPRFSEFGKVLTKVLLERSRRVLCSPDWGAHGGNEYWRTLLDRLTITSVQLPDEAIYVPLGRKTPIGKPGWGSMLSVVDSSLTSIPWEDLDSTVVQTIQGQSDGLTLGDLKDRLRLQDAIEAIQGGDEYVVTNNNGPNSSCHVSLQMESQSVDYPSYPAPFTLMTKLSMTPCSCRPVWRKQRTPSTSPPTPPPLDGVYPQTKNSSTTINQYTTRGTPPSQTPPLPPQHQTHRRRHRPHHPVSTAPLPPPPRPAHIRYAPIGQKQHPHHRRHQQHQRPIRHPRHHKPNHHPHHQRPRHHQRHQHHRRQQQRQQ